LRKPRFLLVVKVGFRGYKGLAQSRHSSGGSGRWSGFFRHSTGLISWSLSQPPSLFQPNAKTTIAMNKLIALALSLTLSSAAFAQTNDNPEVYFATNGQKVTVTVTPQPTVATIKLVDAQGHAIYADRANAAQGIARRLDLTGLEPGTYQLRIEKGTQTVQKTIVIDELPAQKQVNLAE